jgi:2'-5' RNA ligase
VAQGESAVVVVVDAAEQVVGPWRARYDSSAAAGVPPHITVLYPFLPLADVTDDVLHRLGEIFAAEPAFELTLARVERFAEDVLWLAPEPAEPFRRLTQAVWRAWPHHPPYEGAYDDVTPHLTVADRPDPALFDTISADVAGALPCVTQVSEGQMLVVVDGGWSTRATFPLGAGRVRP